MKSNVPGDGFQEPLQYPTDLGDAKIAFPMSHMPRIDLGWLCSLANSHIPELLREQLLKLHIPCERAISAFSARRFARIDIGCYTRCLIRSPSSGKGRLAYIRTASPPSRSQPSVRGGDRGASPSAGRARPPPNQVAL